MQELLSAIARDKTSHFNVTGLRGSATALLAARAAKKSSRSILCIVPSEKQAADLEHDLLLFADVPVFLYPGYEIPPYTPLSPDPGTIATRLAALYETVTLSPPYILISSAEALLRRVLPKEHLSILTELIIKNEETDQEQLSRRLIDGGYENVSLVQTAGEFCVRGGIIDIFSPGFDYPVRLDFFGDTVESIRHFDPITQRSINELDEIVLLPARDILYPAGKTENFSTLVTLFKKKGAELGWRQTEVDRIADRMANRIYFPGIEFFLPFFDSKPAAPLDYLPESRVTFLFNPSDIKKSIRLTWERIEANYRDAEAAGIPALPPESLFVSGSELERSVAGQTVINLSDIGEDLNGPGTHNNQKSANLAFSIACGNHTLIKQHIDLRRQQRGLLQPLTKQLSEWQGLGHSIFFACHSKKHAAQMAELLDQYGFASILQSPPFLSPRKKQDFIVIYDLSISQGFDLPSEKLHFLSESELFGERRLGPRKRSREKPETSNLRFEELLTGDIVVHRAHGLGVYEGLLHLTLNSIANDFLQIRYQGDDKLYVPVDQIGSITKYKGLSDKKPNLDKLGAKSWATTKKKVQDSVWKVARDLLDLYARRQLEKGLAFSRPDEMYSELEESFPFDETSGQIQAINDVILDLTSEQSMDRLVCGDVGYGKTEVAIRAAFKVVADGYQVAVLVPTTVLAEQHAATFNERLQGFPVKIECLDRFRTGTEQKRIIMELASGTADIVIGTHRLLSKDVRFKRLGLLIIDEEHRFGVAHKEKLKKLRTNVDVLTLTATPIPRTLQLSLLDVRDLSVISSPPEHRRSVKTFIARADDLVIKEAVSRELQRGGQVFLVHNRVQSIQDIAFKVQKLVPEARIAVGHGQMPARKLEEIMVRFINREVDVLVCTTIIESGLDIPNANTIIINRADRLGLAEIYQLRGRVGRSREQAYAYLLVPSLDGLTKDARQRLRALMDNNELGGGFKLAMSDLQIRGGGNILGGSQSGHIAAVGYDLYLDLLKRTVNDLKQKELPGSDASEEIDPEINLRISAYIPENYIRDTGQRYIAYRKISGLADEQGLLDLKSEFEDRYGALPQEVKNLFDIITLKNKLRKLKISKLEQGAENLIFTFLDQTPVTPEKILRLVAGSKNKTRFTPEAKLIVQCDKLDDTYAIFAASEKVLHAIM